MKNGFIGFLDSGMGGISVLKETFKILPFENYIYYGDSFNNPYGSKSEDELFKIVSNIVDYLIDIGCKIIVLACNTATVSCLSKLRSKYKDVILVGTVPAIKVSCDNGSYNTLVMATPYTIKTERVSKLIHDNKKDYQSIDLLSCDNLAYLIENDMKEDIDILLNRLLLKYKNSSLDTIVLGCTHYSFIKSKIKEILPNVNLVDGNKGVAREVYHQLDEHDLLNDSGKCGSVTFYNSLSDDLVLKYKKIFDTYEGDL